MFKFGVHTMIWSEDFSEKDVSLVKKAKELGFEVIDIAIPHPEKFPTQQVKEMIKDVGIEVVTSRALDKKDNLIDPDPAIRKSGIESLKKQIDINVQIGAKMLGGVNYAAWGYLTGRPRTEEEWYWSVESMREISLYAKSISDVIIAVEPVNRFETHFLNIAEDAIKYCKDVGNGNVKVHLDSFHMIREESSFTEAVEVCGRENLGYVHVCENNRGIPGTGLVPWKEFFTALLATGFDGPMVIESFDPSFVELSRQCAIWRKFADTGEDLAREGLKNLKQIEKGLS